MWEWLRAVATAQAHIGTATATGSGEQRSARKEPKADLVGSITSAAGTKAGRECDRDPEVGGSSWKRAGQADAHALCEAASQLRYRYICGRGLASMRRGLQHSQEQERPNHCHSRGRQWHATSRTAHALCEPSLAAGCGEAEQAGLPQGDHAAQYRDARWRAHVSSRPRWAGHAERRARGWQRRTFIPRRPRRGCSIASGMTVGARSEEGSGCRGRGSLDRRTDRFSH